MESPNTLNIVDCTYDHHATEILEILNDAILNSTALYDYKPRTIESMSTWFDAKTTNNFPVIGYVEDGQLAGFATYGTFRAWPAYKYSVEHSVYVHKAHRGKGLGLMLMQHLITRANQNDVHVMIGGVDDTNNASVALHQTLGFEYAGTIKEAGFKFGKWLDLSFYQLTLDTPLLPQDDL
jgi:L-amino acid N-acyltransferase YncA